MLHQKQKGFAALLTVMVVLAVVTIATLYTARVISTDQKIYGNVQDQASAMQAAQAGFDYGLGFLNNNIPLVTAALGSCVAAGNSYTVPSNGVSPLSDGSTFNMVLRCISGSNISTLTLTSTGTSAGGVSTKAVSATVKAAGGAGMTPIVATGPVSLGPRGSVINGIAGAQYSVHAGGSITNDTSRPVTLVPPAVFQNDPALSAQTPPTFLTNYMGNPFAFYSVPPPGISYVKLTCSANVVFSSASLLSQCVINNNTVPPAARLSGINGAVIYIDMTGHTLTIIAGGVNPVFTMGSLASSATRDTLVVVNPAQVNLNTLTNGSSIVFNGNIYVEGDFRASTVNGSITVNGLVFAAGDLMINNRTTINGAVASSSVGGVTVSGAPSSVPALNYNLLTAGYLNNSLGGFIGPASLNSGGAGSYGVVAGSWKDF